MFRKMGILFKLLLLITAFGLFCFPLNAIAEDVDTEFEVVEDVTAPTEDVDLDEIIENLAIFFKKLVIFFKISRFE